MKKLWLKETRGAKILQPLRKCAALRIFAGLRIFYYFFVFFEKGKFYFFFFFFFKEYIYRHFFFCYNAAPTTVLRK